MRKLLLFLTGLFIFILNNELYGQLVTGIIINSPGDTILLSNGSAQLSATVFPANAQNKSINWSVSCSPDTASIDSTGHLFFYKVGHFNVKAMARDGSNVFAQKIIFINNG